MYPDEERLFWIVLLEFYEEIKSFKPKYKSEEVNWHTQPGKNCIENIAKEKRDDLDQNCLVHWYALKDISKYKTLPTNTLRNLSLKNRDFRKLIENIKDLRRRLGDDYLNVILKRIGDIENDVIIAVGNKKSTE